jgi:hypothetical protein
MIPWTTSPWTPVSRMSRSPISQVRVLIPAIAADGFRAPLPD